MLQKMANDRRLTARSSPISAIIWRASTFLVVIFYCVWSLHGIWIPIGIAIYDIAIRVFDMYRYIVITCVSTGP